MTECHPHIQFQGLKSRVGLGELIEMSQVQAIKVDIDTLDSIRFGGHTGIILKGIQHFRAAPAVLCSSGIYIDVMVKQIRHDSGFNLTKDELIKSNSEYYSNDVVTFVELERI